MSDVPKTMVKPNQSLEKFTSLSKAVIIMATVHYSKRNRLDSAKGRHIERSPRKSFQVSSPSEITGTHFILPVMNCDNIYKGLSYEGAHPNSGVQGFLGTQSCRHSGTDVSRSDSSTPGQK